MNGGVDGFARDLWRVLDLLGALDGADALDAAHAEDHAVEVADVFGFDDEFDDGFAVVVVADVDAADVGVVVGDDGGEFFQHAGAVVAEDGDLDGVALGAAWLRRPRATTRR